MNIYRFNKEDIIVRTDKVVYTTGACDASYIGEPMIFKGCANGMIYLERVNQHYKYQQDILDLEICSFGEDWEKWIDPKSLTENVIPQIELEKQIKQAIYDENYELAEELKQKLIT